MQEELTAKKQIFIVEDEIISEAIKDCLENLGYSVPDIASSGEEAIDLLQKLTRDGISSHKFIVIESSY